MKPQFDVQELIDNVKRRCSVPTSQLAYTDYDFAQLANDELQGEIVPMIMREKEEFFVDFVDVQSDADGEIAFPNDGIKLRSVCIVQQTSPLSLVNLPRIDLDVVTGIGSGASGFYVQGSTICLYPASANKPVRIYFYKRTLALADPSEYGRVVAIDIATGSIQLTNLPSTWLVDDKLNSVESEGAFSVTNTEMVITGLSSPSIIVNDATGVAVGDYISQQGFSAIPQVPIECHSYLAQLTAVKVLEGLGDSSGMQAAQAKADRLKAGILTVVSQRVDGSTKKVINPNGGLRAGAGMGRGKRGSF